MEPTNSPKLPGKTEWAGRRRPMTRTSGFSVKGPVRMDVVKPDAYQLNAGDSIEIEFSIPAQTEGSICGFGGWYYASGRVRVEILAFEGRHVLTHFTAPNWNKYGSQWFCDGTATGFRVRFVAEEPGLLALYGEQCGKVAHPYLTDARAALMTNMYTIAPEANFITDVDAGEVKISESAAVRVQPRAVQLHLKSCNRCQRYLPVNIPNERAQLSFTNHCSAAHRRPCTHAGFGRIQGLHGGEWRLDYGFQLECRFCKKFEVNAAHNPQRSAAQMKEDAARRRAFELLLEHLYGGSDQLRYRIKTGRELADDVWERFGGFCFKCAAPLDPKTMHLDHTRPLALLWPLDGFATALCGIHNSAKRDHPPAEFYTVSELIELSEITGIPFAELQDPSPNIQAIDLLGENLSWFKNQFLREDFLNTERDGKLPRDLLVKALRKVLARYPGGAPFSLDGL